MSNVVYNSIFAVQEVFAGWMCPAHILVVAISQSEGITKLVVFEDTVVRFLTSADPLIGVYNPHFQSWVGDLPLFSLCNLLCNVQLNMQAVFSTMLSFKVYLYTVDSLLHVDLIVGTLGIRIFLDPSDLDQTVQSDSRMTLQFMKHQRIVNDQVDPASGKKRQ